MQGSSQHVWRPAESRRTKVLLRSGISMGFARRRPRSWCRPAEALADSICGFITRRSGIVSTEPIAMVCPAPDWFGPWSIWVRWFRFGDLSSLPSRPCVPIRSAGPTCAPDSFCMLDKGAMDAADCAPCSSRATDRPSYQEASGVVSWPTLLRTPVYRGRNSSTA